MSRSLALTLVVATLWLGMLVVAFAQASSFPNSAPSECNRHQRECDCHATSYANGLRGYLQQHAKSIAKVTTELVAEIRHNLDAAKKHLDAMMLTAGNDKGQLSSSARIEKHLDDAFAQYKQLHATCSVEDFDAAEAMTCCNDLLVKKVEKFSTEHSELIKSIAKKTGAKPLQ